MAQTRALRHVASVLAILIAYDGLPSNVPLYKKDRVRKHVSRRIQILLKLMLLIHR